MSIKLIAKVLALVLAVACIEGCAGSPYRLSRADAEELQAAEVSDLCWAHIVYQRKQPKIREELLRRQAFTAKEWDAIDARRIFLGMSESALLCSWGMTNYDDFVLRKLKTPEGIRKSYAYLEFDSTSWLLSAGMFIGGASSGDTPVNNSTGMWEVPGEWPKLVYVEDGIIIGYLEGDSAQQTDCLVHKFEFASDCLKFSKIDSSLDSPALYGVFRDEED